MYYVDGEGEDDSDCDSNYTPNSSESEDYDSDSITRTKPFWNKSFTKKAEEIGKLEEKQKNQAV
jgi:hypothetical protein